MKEMFIDNQAASIDLSNFDISKVTNMIGMFTGAGRYYDDYELYVNLRNFIINNKENGKLEKKLIIFNKNNGKYEFDSVNY